MQYEVMKALASGSKLAEEIMEVLEVAGMARRGAVFYQLMLRLEERGWVKGEYERGVVEGRWYRKRRYEITGEGLEVYEGARSFYEEVE
jgi:hypothetical protein